MHSTASRVLIPLRRMDLVEEILDSSHELSTLKIKKLLDAIAKRVPHSLLPYLASNYTDPGCILLISAHC